MYSYEDRLRAVRLYLKLGRRMSATLRQLGYPTKNSLKAWLAEFERNQDLRRGYQRIKRQYTDEQKQRAVESLYRTRLLPESHNPKPGLPKPRGLACLDP